MKLFVGGKLLMAIATLIVGIVTARLLTPEDRGLYALFFTIVGLIVTILHVGISPANIYYANIKKVDLKILTGNTFVYLLVCMILLGLFFIFFSYTKNQNVFSNSNNIIILFFLWIAVLYSLTEVSISGFLLAKNYYNFLNKSLVIQSILLIISSFLIIPAKSNLDLSIGIRVGLIMLFIMWFIKNFLTLFNFNKFLFSFDILKDQIYFGSKNWLQNIIGFLNVRSYILILGFISSPDVVGYFSIAWIFVELIRFLPDTISTMLLPELTNQDSKNQQVRFTLRLLKILFCTVLIITVIGYFVLDYLIYFIFGMAYADSSSIAKLLTIGAAIGVIYQVLTRYYTSQSQQFYSIVSGSIGLVVGLTSSFILVPLYGGEGAAFAYIFSSIITAIFAFYFFFRSTKTSTKPVFTVE